ncbi:MAG TPA: hypothetical protein PLP88_05225, partial [Bacteroidales bacterium]|nr:hypothetical protein [Bacteroidales bacterium]
MTKTKLTTREFMLPFIMITSLFFLWGLAHGMVDTLDKHFQQILHLHKWQSSFIQFSLYGAYFTMALPAGYFTNLGLTQQLGSRRLDPIQEIVKFSRLFQFSSNLNRRFWSRQGASPLASQQKPISSDSPNYRDMPRVVHFEIHADDPERAAAFY